MGPPGFGKAAAQGFVVAVKKHQCNVQVLAVQQGRDIMLEMLQIELPGAHIDTQRQRPVERRGMWFSGGVPTGFLERRIHRADKIGKQRQRQIVDHFIAIVFKHLQRSALASARHSGDQ